MGTVKAVFELEQQIKISFARTYSVILVDMPERFLENSMGRRIFLLSKLKGIFGIF